MNTSIHWGVRTSVPPGAFVSFLQWHKDVLQDEVFAVKEASAAS